MKQNVTEDTHIDGHTLDLVITKLDNSILKSCNIRDPGLSAHYAVHCKKLVNSRNL